MIPVEEIRNPEVCALATRAHDFLASHPWCKNVRSGQLAWANAGILGVFQFTLDPTSAEVDNRLWIVVGDLPPAYLVLDCGPTWRDALEGYVEQMQWWVESVRTGASLEDVIPVNVAPTRKNADHLASRLAFIREQILAANPASLESDV